MKDILKNKTLWTIVGIIVLILLIRWVVRRQIPFWNTPYERQGDSGCQCYCSDACGPRNRKSSDSPFVDSETGLCFCAPRDKANYIPNGCQPKQFANSCCG